MGSLMYAKNVSIPTVKEAAKPTKSPVMFSMNFEKSEVVAVKRAISKPSLIIKNTMVKKSERSKIFC